MQRTGRLAPVSAKKLAELEAAGLTPGSTLRRTGGTRRAAGTRGGQAARPTPAEFSPAVRAVICRRDGCCQRCGRLCWGARGRDWSIQHRVARGAGGSRRAELGQPANGILLCGDGVTGCHGEVEQRGDADRVLGYWLHRDTDGQPTDPATVPLFSITARTWVLLDNEGGWEPTDAPEEVTRCG